MNLYLTLGLSLIPLRRIDDQTNESHFIPHFLATLSWPATYIKFHHNKWWVRYLKFYSLESDFHFHQSNFDSVLLKGLISHLVVTKIILLSPLIVKSFFSFFRLMKYLLFYLTQFHYSFYLYIHRATTLSMWSLWLEISDHRSIKLPTFRHKHLALYYYQWTQIEHP